MTKACDWFYGDVPDENFAELYSVAEAFVQCGGVISIDEWDRMTTSAKAAITKSKEIERARFAALIGAAFRSPEAVLAEADGGQSLADKLARDCLNAVAAKRGWL